MLRRKRGSAFCSSRARPGSCGPARIRAGSGAGCCRAAVSAGRRYSSGRFGPPRPGRVEGRDRVRYRLDAEAPRGSGPKYCRASRRRAWRIGRNAHQLVGVSREELRIGPQEFQEIRRSALEAALAHRLAASRRRSARPPSARSGGSAPGSDRAWYIRGSARDRKRRRRAGRAPRAYSRLGHVGRRG